MYKIAINCYTIAINCYKLLSIVINCYKLLQKVEIPEHHQLMLLLGLAEATKPYGAGENVPGTLDSNTGRFYINLYKNKYKYIKIYKNI